MTDCDMSGASSFAHVSEPRMSKDRRGDSLLRMKSVQMRTGLSDATIYRREAAGTFPRRVQIGEKCVAWYESDIDDFISDPMGYRAP